MNRREWVVVAVVATIMIVMGNLVGFVGVWAGYGLAFLHMYLGEKAFNE